MKNPVRWPSKRPGERQRWPRPSGCRGGNRSVNDGEPVNEDVNP
jgi:hypothetical protein